MNRMDKIRAVVIALALTTLFSSCLPSASARGNANIRTRKVSISNTVTQLENNSPFNITCLAGRPGITITGPVDEVENVSIREKGNKIEIDSKTTSMKRTGKNVFSNEGKEVNITISLPDITSIENSGAGNVRAERIDTDKFTVKTIGAGTTKIGKLTATVVKIATSGAGDVDISTQDCSSVQILCQGAGDVDIDNLTAVTFNAVVQGAGDLDVGKMSGSQVEVVCQGAGDADLQNLNVKTLRALAQGSGDITLSGKSGNSTLTVQGAGDLDARRLKSGKVNTYKQGVGSLKY